MDKPSLNPLQKLLLDLVKFCLGNHRNNKRKLLTAGRRRDRVGILLDQVGLAGVVNSAHSEQCPPPISRCPKG